MASVVPTTEAGWEGVDHPRNRALRPSFLVALDPPRQMAQLT